VANPACSGLVRLAALGSQAADAAVGRREGTSRMKLTSEQLKLISDSVGERTGWDFSQMHTERAPVPWSYSDVVRRFLTRLEYVLDIGTGGGEMFLTLAPYFRKGIGIDTNPGMIEQAQQNKAVQGSKC